MWSVPNIGRVGGKPFTQSDRASRNTWDRLDSPLDSAFPHLRDVALFNTDRSRWWTFSRELCRREWHLSPGSRLPPAYGRQPVHQQGPTQHKLLKSTFSIFRLNSSRAQSPKRTVLTCTSLGKIYPRVTEYNSSRLWLPFSVAYLSIQPQFIPVNSSSLQNIGSFRVWLATLASYYFSSGEQNHRSPRSHWRWDLLKSVYSGRCGELPILPTGV